MKTVAIVGNGPLSSRDKSFVQSSDIVTRFNVVPRSHIEAVTKTTELFLACSTKQIGEYFAKGTFQNDIVFRNATTIVLPYAPEIIAKHMRKPSILSRLKGRRSDWTDVCCAVAGDYGKNVEILTPQDYYDACAALNIESGGRDYYPSSGFLAIRRALRIYPALEYSIHLLGFGFVGWKRHLWAAEKAITLKLALEERRLELHPVAPED